MGNKLKTVDAETLLSTPMSKTMFIVDGLISQGVNVISGASKIGKSWLMLDLCLSVASGQKFLDMPTNKTDCLYLALEALRIPSAASKTGSTILPTAPRTTCISP